MILLIFILKVVTKKNLIVATTIGTIWAKQGGIDITHENPSPDHKKIVVLIRSE